MRRFRTITALLTASAVAGTLVGAAADTALAGSITGVRLVPTDFDGDQPSARVEEPMLTPDGKWLVFSSDADDLVANDGNGYQDVFVKDMTTGAITMLRPPVAEPSDNNSYQPTICDNGSKIAFTSDSDLFDVDVLDTNLANDVYVYDRDTDDDGILDEAGATAYLRRSVDDSGFETDNGGYRGRISGNCEWVVFVSEDPLVGGDNNDSIDVYVKHTEEDTLKWISKGSASDGGSGDFPNISDSGRHIVFASYATDIIAGNPGKYGYYLRDRDADNDGTFDESGTASSYEFVNRSAAGVPSGGAPDVSSIPAITGDGSCVAFKLFNANGLSSDEVQKGIYVKRRTTGAVELASKSTLGLSATDAFNPSISDDCAAVGFDSADNDLMFGVDLNPGPDVFVRKLVAGELTLVSRRADDGPITGAAFMRQVRSATEVIVETAAPDLGGAATTNGFANPVLVTIGTSDTVAPSGVAFSGWGTGFFSTATSIPVRWRASDNAGAPRITLTKRTIDATGKLSTWGAFSTSTGSSSKSLALRSGVTTCLKAQARDLAGNRGPSVVVCKALPLLAGNLTYSKGWKSVKSTSAFGGRFFQTKTKGASFSKANIKGQRFALVVTKCKGCGTVGVYFNNKLVKTLNLNDSKTRGKVVIEVLRKTSATKGTLKVVVTSTGKPVNVEGLGVYTQLR